MTTILFALIIIINMAGYYSAYLLTENEATRISRIKILDRKPFNCKKCLTFHLTMIIQTIVALHTGLLSYFIYSIILALSTFAFNHYEEKIHIKK